MRLGSIERLRQRLWASLRVLQRSGKLTPNEAEQSKKAFWDRVLHDREALRGTKYYSQGELKYLYR